MHRLCRCQTGRPAPPTLWDSGGSAKRPSESANAFKPRAAELALSLGHLRKHRDFRQNQSGVLVSPHAICYPEPVRAMQMSGLGPTDVARTMLCMPVLPKAGLAVRSPTERLLGEG